MTAYHDLSLHSGERQVATDYSAIRADHRFRYEWVNDRIPASGFGLDVFCGNGYGTWLLSTDRQVIGIDGSADAIRLAEQHFRTPRTIFSVGYFPFELPERAFDFVVSLESVEHVEDGSRFFAALVSSLKPGGLLAFSTPCEDRLPLAMTGNRFHFRHYALEETLSLAASDGLELLEWAGQDTYSFQPDGRQGALLDADRMRLMPAKIGQFIIVLCRKRSG
ncbi:MAG: class I SAM-dependent methyltransferase [Elusimicrobiota bacterium]